jgi:Autotransporter beta-domain
LPAYANPAAWAIFQPGVALYESYPQILLQLMSMPTLRERVGNRHMAGGRPGYAAAASSGDDGMTYLGGPGRGYDAATAAYGDVASAWWAAWTPAASASSHHSRWPVPPTMRTKCDCRPASKMSFTPTAMANWSLASRFSRATPGHANSVLGDGKINVDGYGIGGTLTWYGLNGFYVDDQAQVNWFETDIRSALAGSMADGDDAVGHGVSIETGKRFAVDGPVGPYPQAQLAYSRAAATSPTRSALMSRPRMATVCWAVSASRSTTATPWLGASGPSRSPIYGIANLYYEFLDGTMR